MVPKPWIPLGLNRKQARELKRGNVIHQIQQNYQTLLVEVSQMSTELREVLAHLRNDPGGGMRRSRVPQREEPSSSPSSSSQDEESPKRERRPPRRPMDDLRDVKFDHPKFEGNLNPDLFIELIQALERFFEVKEYFDENAFKVAILKVNKYASHWYGNVKKQSRSEGKPRIKTWLKLKKLMTKRFLPINYKRDLYLRVSSLS